MGSVVAAIRVVLAGLIAAFAGAAGAACSPDVVELRGTGAVARFTVEVADDPAERAVGLMNRESMASSGGMLFVYEQPQRAQFWMRNTLIPLDMIFADRTGLVTRVHENAIPLDETSIDGGLDVKFVLEINGGLARAMGIAPGAALRHPAVAQELAVWRCD